MINLLENFGGGLGGPFSSSPSESELGSGKLGGPLDLSTALITSPEKHDFSE